VITRIVAETAETIAAEAIAETVAETTHAPVRELLEKEAENNVNA
jgi:hypothetical protein